MTGLGNDFEAFLTAEESKPPEVLTEALFTQIRQDLNPSAWKVFSRISAIHTVAGALSLVFVCPQFGISPLGHTALMEWFMQFGHEVCMIACGSVFMGGSALAMSFLLTTEEVRVIRRTRLVQLGTLALLSIGAFLCVGAGIVVSLALFWILGSLAGGWATLELGLALRARLTPR